MGDPACAINPVLSTEINYLAVKNFCKTLSSGQRIIFASTCSVYGANNDILNEESPTNPLSVYAKTKLEAEKHVLAKHGIVFRLGTVFGLSDTYSRIRSDLVVNIMTIKAFTDKKIKVFGGMQWRPIISVNDVAYYLSETCERNDIKEGIYLLSRCNVCISGLGKLVAKTVHDITGNKIKVEHSDISFEDARNYQVDTAKANSTFIHKASINPDYEIRRICQLLIEKRIKNINDMVYNNGMYIKNFGESELVNVR